MLKGVIITIFLKLNSFENFSEENIAKAGITRRFSNNGELEDCISEVKSAILGGMYGY